MIKLRPLLIVAICVVLMAAGETPALATGHATDNDRATVLPPDSRILGRTYGEWNAKWWKPYSATQEPVIYNIGIGYPF